MSIYDVAHARALKVWKKARREGWLDEHLRGNTRGKKASKQAFTGGYLRAIIDFETIVKEQSDGQILRQDIEQNANGNEKCEVRSRVGKNLSGQTYKGEI